MKKGYTTTYIRTYHMGDDDSQNAIICFTNGRFDKVVFHTNKVPYTIEDWEFLRQVSSKVLEMVNEEKSLYEKVTAL